MSDVTDTSATLLQRLQDPGNADAWAEFAGRYGRAIKGWCLRRGLQEADADEVSQGIVAEIHDRLRRFSYDPWRGRFRGWLRAVTHSACANFLERDASRRFRPLVDDLPARDDLDAEVDREARRELMEAAAARVRARVTGRDWDVFRELTSGGRKAPEIAEGRGLSVASVYMIKHRILAQIREEVRRLDGGDPGAGES
ncbi:RNA polymerase sigma factor SigX [Aquisphaera giovannonii]|uniref:RNA polymerase sigma factor SigX n=1 Tax=Aquisphaera giovannonii TaxID=406548 RepID=A0A5B9VY75_9BACT|nr:sigma-70 family RNA polymerase sigma factor [Aquisphaera giovannonii]QEH32937.1 RNA polymerase sigma factor SigX [Aquisphaera giovannonii]